MATQSSDDGESKYSYHYEPAAQGGAKYIRCEECGSESVPAHPDRVLHRPECSEADR